MDKYYCTLGAGYPERVQTIIASSRQRAREIMFARFGKYWAFDYNEEQWNQALEDGFFKEVNFLPTIVDERDR